MNDDWDGVSWAEHFSGPDDAEFERRRQEDFETTQRLEQDTTKRGSATFHNYDSDGVVFREGEFATFEAAQNHAKKSSAEYHSIFRIERVNTYWKSYADYSYVRFDDEVEPIRQDPPYLAGVELVEALRKFERVRALQILDGEVDVHGLSSALIVAAYRGYADVCERLLSLGAIFKIGVSIDSDDPRRKCSEEDGDPIDTVMHRANLSRDWPTIEVIGKAYVTAEWNFLKPLLAEDPSDLQYFCFPRLVIAARYGMTNLCAEMISSGVEVNKNYVQCNFFSEQDESPLLAAFQNKHTSTCLTLIALGADISDLEKNMPSIGAFKILFETTKNILDTSANRTE